MTKEETHLSMEECLTRLVLLPGRSMVGYQEFVMHERGDHGDAPLIIFQTRFDLKTPKELPFVEDALKSVVLYLLTKKLERAEELQLLKNAINTVT